MHTVVGNTVGPQGETGEIREDKYSSNFVKEMNLSSPKHGFRSPRGLYTWKAPGDGSLQELFYILVKHRFRNSTKHVQTLSGADIDSDHNLLVAEIYTRV